MKNTHRWIGFACAVSAAVVVTLAGQLMVPRFDIVNIAMVYLLAVVLIAVCFSRGAAILSAVLCVAAFDFTFVPPQGAFTINDIQYLLTFAIMLTVAVVISVLMEHRRRHDQQRAALELQADTERIRSTLLASISHDLRTPLASLVGMADALELTAPPPSAATAPSRRRSAGETTPTRWSTSWSRSTRFSTIGPPSCLVSRPPVSDWIGINFGE